MTYNNNNNSIQWVKTMNNIDFHCMSLYVIVGHCNVPNSQMLTVTGTDSRDDPDGRFLTVLSIYVGPSQQTIPRRNLNIYRVGKLV
jgi:hypothetical protein